MAAKKTDSAPVGRGIVKRADGQFRRRMTIYLPPELATELAVVCAKTAKDLSDVTAEALGE